MHLGSFMKSLRQVRENCKNAKSDKQSNWSMNIYIYIYINVFDKPETKGRKKMGVSIQLATGVVVGHPCGMRCGTRHLTI